MLQGCSTNAPDPAPAVYHPRRVWEGAPGDAPWPVVAAAWRDVAAAVNWAGAENGFAVTTVVDDEPLARTFEFITLRGRPGAIRFRAARLAEGSLPSDEWVSFEVDADDAETESAVRDALLRYRPKHAR